MDISCEIASSCLDSEQITDLAKTLARIVPKFYENEYNQEKFQKWLHNRDPTFDTAGKVADKLDVDLGEALNGVKTWEK